jgi:hypothetical protein
MLAVTDDHYDEVSLKNKDRQTSSIEIDALMNSVDKTFHYADMEAVMAVISSKNLTLCLCKSAERL